MRHNGAAKIVMYYVYNMTYTCKKLTIKFIFHTDSIPYFHDTIDIVNLKYFSSSVMVRIHQNIMSTSTVCIIVVLYQMCQTQKLIFCRFFLMRQV